MSLIIVFDVMYTKIKILRDCLCLADEFISKFWRVFFYPQDVILYRLWDFKGSSVGVINFNSVLLIEREFLKIIILINVRYFRIK